MTQCRTTTPVKGGRSQPDVLPNGRSLGRQDIQYNADNSNGGSGFQDYFRRLPSSPPSPLPIKSFSNKNINISKVTYKSKAFI